MGAFYLLGVNESIRENSITTGAGVGLELYSILITSMVAFS
jgi:hypothetical protein